MPNLFHFFTAGSLMIPAAILLGNAVPCNAKAQPSVDGSLKITILGGRPVVDGVYLNGQGPFRFLIDTGAQTNQVEAPIVRKLEIKPTFRVEVATATGNILVPGGRVAEVTLGPATASNQEFLFSDLEAIHTFSSSIKGVLGQEFLSHFDYLLDFSSRRILFGAVEPEGGHRTQMDLIEGCPAVETDRGRFILDSGTETAILFGGSSPVSEGQLLTASGAVSASAIQSLRLRIAGHQYVSPTVSVPRVSPQVSPQIVGLLPVRIFQRVYVSNSGRYLVIDPPARSDQGGRTRGAD
jgi:Aspartyl protease